MSDLSTHIPSVPAATKDLSTPDPEATELDRHITRIQQTLSEDLEELLSLLHKEVWLSFSSTWDRANQKHKEILAERPSLLDPEAPLSWKEISDYRRQVHRHIFLRINRLFTPPIVSRIDNHVSRYFNTLRQKIEEYPQGVIIPEHPELFEAHENDQFITRQRKWIRRNRIAVQGAGYSIMNGFRRLFRMKALTAPKRVQVVPLRHLLLYHLTVRLNNQIQPAVLAFHEVIASHLAAFEFTQTKWLHGVLTIEHEFYTPGNVLNDEKQWLLGNTTPSPDTNGPSRKQGFIDLVNALQEAFTFETTQWEERNRAFTEATSSSTNDLLYDVRRGGTILLNTHERSVPTLPQFASIDNSWRLWHEEVQQRLLLCTNLLEFRDRLLAGNNKLIASISEISIQPVIASHQTLLDSITDAREEIMPICEKAIDEKDRHILADALPPLQKKLSKEFRGILENVSSLVGKSGHALEQPGETVWSALSQHAMNFPDQVHVHFPGSTLPPLKKIPSLRYAIRFREIISSSLNDPTFTYYLDKPAASLQKGVIRSLGETQEVEQIIEYNLNAAREELSEETTQHVLAEPLSPDEELPDHDPLSAAEELIGDGLARSAEKLEDLNKLLRAPWADFVAASFKRTNKYWTTIHEDILFQDDLHDWWTNLRIRFVRSLRQFVYKGNDLRSEAWHRIRRVVRFGRKQTKQLNMRVQSAVGVVEQSEEEWLQTLHLVSNVSSLHQRMPKIYPRLFSLKPLRERDLLEGRDEDLATIQRHFELWQKRQTGSLLLSMVEGSGRTSLMNVLQHSIFKEARVHRLTLEQRVVDLATWTQLIATTLGYDPNEYSSLEILEAHMSSEHRSNPPEVVLIDQFEQLLLCTPGGMDVLERILIFISRTEHKIYWVANMDHYAWYFIKHTIHPSFGFITAYEVSAIGRHSLEEIILRRHNRSGINLKFTQEISSTSIFTFSRFRDEESRQRLLRQLFFDDLYEKAGQDILLALLYWLRSITFNPDDDTVYVNPIDEINFSFLDTFDLTRAFTLKSFLVHGTLTLEEHMCLFRTRETESIFIMESLLNLRIIERDTSANGEQDQQLYILPGMPYRIHPLIRYPVVSYLDDKHKLLGST